MNSITPLTCTYGSSRPCKHRLSSLAVSQAGSRTKSPCAWATERHEQQARPSGTTSGRAAGRAGLASERASERAAGQPGGQTNERTGEGAGRTASGQAGRSASGRPGEQAPCLAGERASERSGARVSERAGERERERHDNKLTPAGSTADAVTDETKGGCIGTIFYSFSAAGPQERER